METKSNNTKRLLALALTAAVIAFGSATARATLIQPDSVDGCLLTGASATATLGQMQTACGSAASNRFGAAAVDPGVLVGNGTEFSFTGQQWAFSVDFEVGTGIVTTTIKNGGAARAGVNGVHLLFGDLDFGEGWSLGDNPFVDVSLVSDAKTSSFDEVSDLLKLPIDIGANGDGDWIHIAFKDGTTWLAGETVTVQGRLNPVPEPGSLALLGVVLLAIGLTSIKRVRILRARAAGLAS